MKAARLKRLIALMTFAACIFTLAGCTQHPAVTGYYKDNSLKKVLDAGQLVLGLDTEFPPMGFIDDKGEIVGFDIDVAEEVCRRLGVTLVKKGIDWDSKEDELNSGSIDCIWNGMSITPARAEAMNLSEPYMKNELIVAIMSSSSIKGMRDLDGRTIGVQSGSTAEDVLRASDSFSDITIIEYPDNLTLFDKLEAGEMDAALVDSIVAYYYVFSSSEKFYILPDSLEEEEYAIGFRKNDQALRDRIQEIISDMKTDGTLGKISKNWFGSDITTVR